MTSDGPAASTASAGEPDVALGTDRGDWNVYYLQLHNADYDANRSRCSATAELLSRVPRSYQHSFFSAVAPGTHITPHTGPTNKKLRCHLPLVVPPGDKSRIRVGDQVLPFEEGKCFVFDDSFEHEVWNDAGTWGADDPESAACLLVHSFTCFVSWLVRSFTCFVSWFVRFVFFLLCELTCFE